jgi:hypothetical protein
MDGSEQGARAPHTAQAAINGLHGKSVTVNVKVSRDGCALSKEQVNSITRQVQAKLREQHKRPEGP